MRLDGQRESDNVTDVRGQTAGRGKLTIGTILVAGLISYFTGANPLQVISLLVGSGSTPQYDSRSSYQSTPEQEKTKHLLSVVLASTEDVWKDQFHKYGTPYSDPNLVIFTDEIQSACGLDSSATGPFYCSADQKLYLDIGFLGELQRTLGAEGDFAAAYVVAHEVGHHVQTLLGLDEQFRNMRERSSSPNLVQVKMELQADCLAGVWGHYAQQQGLLDVGDVEQGINAAKAVGDDRIQSMHGGQVNPDSFTHGSGAERAKWFKSGFASGDLKDCDTIGSR